MPAARARRTISEGDISRFAHGLRQLWMWRSNFTVRIIANFRRIWYTCPIMNIFEIVKTLDGTLVAGGDSDRTVGTVVANDLMSDVLLNDGEDILLLTSLASDQAIRTANIVGAMAVVVHNAKPLPQTMCQVADTLGIPLIGSPLSKYDSCVRIYKFLEAERK